MFKGLFRNHGDVFMSHFQGHLERLVDQDQESAHRCASEIIAGIIRGNYFKTWIRIDKITKGNQMRSPTLPKIRIFDLEGLRHMGPEHLPLARL